MIVLKKLLTVLLLFPLGLFAQQNLPLNGRYISFNDSAKTKKSVEGTFSNGKKIGVWTEWDYKGVVISKGKYAKGKREGEWIFQSAPYGFPKNYTKETGKFKKGIRVGKWIVFDSSGKQIEKQEYVVKKNINYFTSYYANGQKKETGQYTYLKDAERFTGWDDKRGNGARNGVWTAWHENGQVSSEIEYKNGQYNGKNVNYINGKMNSEMLYKEDKLLRSIRYKENGEIDSVSDYEK